MFLSIFLLIAGFSFLLKGADWLVDGSASLAKRFKIPEIVIGLTIVAFGTSAPELVVNVVASFTGRSEIAIGNILGSNIANILLILGIAGLIYPLSVKKDTVWKEIPLSFLAVLIVGVMANDVLLGNQLSSFLSRGDGLVLLGYFLVFLYYIYSISKKKDSSEVGLEKVNLSKSIGLSFSGLIFLILGGYLAVENAVVIATFFGVSQSIIGLTIVAIGTSLPELVTSAVAAFKKKPDIAIGNVVGSNIFNIFWILGISALIRPLPFLESMNWDVLAGIIASFILFLWMFIGRKHTLERWQAGVLLAGYLGYVAFLIIKG